jgi:hypothetical protein
MAVMRTEWIISIQKIPLAGSRSQDGNTYEIALRHQPGAFPILLSFRKIRSVSKLKRIAEELFGPDLQRRDAEGTVRSSANCLIEIHPIAEARGEPICSVPAVES